MTVGTPNSSKRLKRISYAKYGYLFSLPFILAYLIFSLYPTIYTAILGFTDCEGIGNTDWNILEGNVFANFKWVLQNELFKKTIKNTIVIWILNFIPQITMALILTAWFTSRRNVRQEDPVRIVLITGPSSSGKSTFCKRLSDERPRLLQPLQLPRPRAAEESRRPLGR